MAIKKKLIHFETFSNFNSQKLSANKENTQYTVGVNGSVITGEPTILYQSICFIKDESKIWTHGALYDCANQSSQISESITYSEFVAKVDNGELVEGCLYRITDYETVVAGDYLTTAPNHGFDLIVLATSSNSYSNKCWAAPTDRYQYPPYVNCQLDKWQIWWSHERTNQLWVPETGHKGVIYRMIDEWGNDCPYDFKSIMLKVPAFASDVNGTLGTIESLADSYYYTFTIMIDGEIHDASVYLNSIDEDSAFCANNVIKSSIVDGYNDEDSSPFPYVMFLASCGDTYSDLSSKRIYNNVIGESTTGVLFFAECNYFSFSNNSIGKNSANIRLIARQDDLQNYGNILRNNFGDNCEDICLEASNISYNFIDSDSYAIHIPTIEDIPRMPYQNISGLIIGKGVSSISTDFGSEKREYVYLSSLHVGDSSYDIHFNSSYGTPVDGFSTNIGKDCHGLYIDLTYSPTVNIGDRCTDITVNGICTIGDGCSSIEYSSETGASQLTFNSGVHDLFINPLDGIKATVIAGSPTGSADDIVDQTVAKPENGPDNADYLLYVNGQNKWVAEPIVSLDKVVKYQDNLPDLKSIRVDILEDGMVYALPLGSEEAKAYADCVLQEKIDDLDDIRSGAAKGATALQTVPSEYVTQTELEDKLEELGIGRMVKHTSDEQVVTIEPNTFHVWDSVYILNVTLGEAKEGEKSEYLFQFTAGVWLDECLIDAPFPLRFDTSLEVKYGHTYLMHIVNGNGTVYEYEPYVPDDEIWFYTDGGPLSAPNLANLSDKYGPIAYTYDAYAGKHILKIEGVWIREIPDGTFAGSNLWSVMLPSAGVRIGDYAFSDCENLQNIYMPFVEKIGIEAFRDCPISGTIDLEYCESIGEGAFEGTSVHEIIIPQSITTIPVNCFYGCQNLHIVKLSEGLKVIGDSAFSDCSNLKGITIPSTVELIGQEAFLGCTNIKKIEIPSGVLELFARCFAGCTSLEEVIWHEGKSGVYFRSIYSQVFDGCTNLCKVNIPEGVTDIQSEVFASTAISTLVLPSTITDIDTYAFNQMPNLQTIYCKAPRVPYVVGSGLRTQVSTIYVPEGVVEDYQSANGWSNFADVIVGHNFYGPWNANLTNYYEKREIDNKFENFKTINGESILGSGDIVISGGGSSGGSGAYAEVNHGTNDTTFTLTPNTFHVWDKVASLDLTLGSETSGVANEYLFQFTSGSTATSLVLPDDIKWANDELTIEPDKIYQVSILKGLGSVLEFDNAKVLIDNLCTYDGNKTVTFQYPVASDVTVSIGQSLSRAVNIVVKKNEITATTTSMAEPMSEILQITPKYDNTYNYVY